MRKLLTIASAALLLLLSLPSPAQYTGKKTADIKLGPWLQAVTDHSFTVVWLTNAPAAGWVEIAPDDGSPFFQCDRPKFYQSIQGKRPIDTLHCITVDGLQPGTKYRYRVMQQGVITAPDDKRIVFGIPTGNDPFRMKPYEVTTLDPEAEEFDFCVINDIHGKDSVFQALMAPIKEDSIDMVLFNGDMLSSMDSEQQLIDGYLRSACKLFATDIPFYNLRGNHESRGLFSYNHMRYFPSTTGEAFYMIRQGPAAILMLDCGEDKPDSDVSYYGLMVSDQYREKEAVWLADIVKSKEWLDASVKIALLHIPPSKNGGWHGGMEIQRLFMPILEEAGIDLMISGHIHRYSFSDKGVRADSFPVLINAANEKHYFHVTRDGISAKRIDMSGAVLKTYEFKK
ncbi:MAG: metallophosphoesterase [Bacteroidales bacterium]|nr:metallophosphoesterase [Bacteroidales bacterium]